VSNWPGAIHWRHHVANTIAPTIVGGSKKHGGADLGPTRSRAAWRMLGVDGSGVANDDDIPGSSTPADALFRLTVRMGARIQGFPDSWVITGRKTAAWRTVGNAFPPPVAFAVGSAIHRSFTNKPEILHDIADDTIKPLVTNSKVSSRKW